MSLSASPAVGPWGIPPDAEAGVVGVGVERVAVDVVTGGDGAAVVGVGVERAAVDVVTGGEGAGVEGAGVWVVPVEAATRCEAAEILALAGLALAGLATCRLCGAGGCDRLVAAEDEVEVDVAAGGADALVAVEELDEADPQAAMARLESPASISPRLARQILGAVMAVRIFDAPVLSAGERSA